MDFYVSTNGNDLNDGLSIESPFRTVEKAVESVTDDSTIYVEYGEYEISMFVNLSSANGKVTIKSLSQHYRKIPTFVIKKVIDSPTNFKGQLDVYNIKFIPSDDFGGAEGGLFIIYSTDSYVCNFYNCYFSVSNNQLYPISALMCFHNNNNYYGCNKSFYNCSFNGRKNNSIIQSHINGAVNYYGCAMTNTSTIVGSNFENCKINVSYVNNCKLTENNFLYGVYSGENTWLINNSLLRQNNNYYSINESHYNSNTQIYNPLSGFIEDEMFDIGLLLKQVTIGNETFRPIDKFEKFSIVSNETFNASITGIKQNTSMIVASDTFGVRNASNIDYFKGYYTLSIDSYIKMAVSVDEGETWKTATVLDGVTTWTDLNITIPKNMYSSLTSAEKAQWDNAKDVIYNNGMDISILETIDFNQIKDKNMMFAYVLYMPALDSVCKNQSLEWKFDSRGRMKKMKDTEYDLYLTYDNIIVTPLSVQSMIKINVVG